MNCQILTILTPKKFILNGLYFGPSKPKNLYIYLHGLGGNMLSHAELTEKIVNSSAGVSVFNNRGAGLINGVKKVDLKKDSGYSYQKAGSAHEVFTECVDDIAGAIESAKKIGAKNIYLMGHSTGCQKIIYYLAKKKIDNIQGAILLAPMSDYPSALIDKKASHKAEFYARKLVKAGRDHELLPENIWPSLIDAQRYLSLYTPDSAEEIFTYASNQEPKLLKKVKVPLLIVLAGDDQHRDRPVAEIADWFKINRRVDKIKIIKNSQHHFKGFTKNIVKEINSWQI